MLKGRTKNTKQKQKTYETLEISCGTPCGNSTNKNFKAHSMLFKTQTPKSTCRIRMPNEKDSDRKTSDKKNHSMLGQKKIGLGNLQKMQSTPLTPSVNRRFVNLSRQIEEQRRLVAEASTSVERAERQFHQNSLKRLTMRKLLFAKSKIDLCQSSHQSLKSSKPLNNQTASISRKLKQHFVSTSRRKQSPFRIMG